MLVVQAGGRDNGIGDPYFPVSGTTISGGTEVVLGLAYSATVDSGGLQVVSSGGLVTSSLINSGGVEVISSGGLTSGVFIASGGEVIVSNGGVQSGGSLGSGSLAGVGGVVGAGTVVVASGGTTDRDLLWSGGREIVKSGGLAENIGLAGGTLEIQRGGSAENISFGGPAGLMVTSSTPSVLVLDASTSFSGTIGGFYPGRTDEIDLRDIAFGTTKKSQLSYNGANGTLSVTDGVHTAVLRLGYAIAGGFAVSSDGYGGTLLTFESSVTSTTGGHGHGNAVASPVTS